MSVDTMKRLSELAKIAASRMRPATLDALAPTARWTGLYPTFGEDMTPGRMAAGGTAAFRFANVAPGLCAELMEATFRHWSNALKIQDV